ncbi:hypothetical protein V3C99_018551, partial [Haemonchus contortus]
TMKQLQSSDLKVSFSIHSSYIFSVISWMSMLHSGTPLQISLLRIMIAFIYVILTTDLSSGECLKDGSICSESDARVCQNGTCISACSLQKMNECQCDAEEDNYCYLCCGNANHQCLPAHHHNILR